MQEKILQVNIFYLECKIFIKWKNDGNSDFLSYNVTELSLN